MNILILHSPLDGASRQFVASVGIEPTRTDESATVEGQVVRIISDHALAVSVCPEFGAYPALVVIADDETRRVLAPVTSWAQALAFAQTPIVPTSTKTLTYHEFRLLFTFAERVAWDNSTIPEVVTMRNDLVGAESINLDQVASYRAEMLKSGLITEERLNQVLAGVRPGGN